ncbi:MAG: hypothetical protein ACK4Z5_01595 [Brevundimonas sp.]
MRQLVLAAALAMPLAVAGCASTQTTGTVAPVTVASAGAEVVDPALNAIAEDYVRLILGVGELEPGYVDAYYGPEAWPDEVKAAAPSREALIAQADALTARLSAVPTAGLDDDRARRVRYLLAHTSAARARLRMLGGERMSFADEAHALFGVRPEMAPLETYAPVLARIDALVPGDGPLHERVAAFRARSIIPTDRLDAVMRAAIAECRARTVRHIDLPAGETFTLEFVNDKPWSGYNYFQGGANSLIQINTDLPIYIDRAVDLGCHEGYPGHHVYNALLEKTFVVDRGWVEMSVYPLYSPMSFIAEGSANYGIDLAFPGETRAAWEAEALYPLAGLEPSQAGANAELLALTRRLARAEYVIADDFLSGRVDRETTLDRLQTYGLSDRARARQRLSFIETYRSYIINYGLGRDTVQAWVEAQGPDRWATTERLLGSQILPADLF